jgi:hypothetical protein
VRSSSKFYIAARLVLIEVQSPTFTRESNYTKVLKRRKLNRKTESFDDTIAIVCWRVSEFELHIPR